MKASIPRGDFILVDSQSSLPITYYYCGPREIVPIDMSFGGFYQFSCNGNTIVSLRIWKLVTKNFRLQFEKMARSHGLKPGDRVWVYQTGWGPDLGTELAGQDAAFRCLTPRKFGGGVTVTPFIVGPEFMPEAPSGAC
jgi:hypothetical protein